MRVLIFSDGHGKLKNIEALKSEIEKSDLLLFAGDFTKFAHPKTGKSYLEKLKEFAKPTFSVLGNCDYPEILEMTKKFNFSVDGAIKQHGKLYITGAGGGSKFTGTTPNERTDDEFAKDLDIAGKKLDKKEITANKLIVITHNPPLNTNLDLASKSKHVGSKAIRDFIEKHEPLLHISGHIHESVGQDKIGKTILINPGALADGHYVTCKIEDKGHFEINEISFQQI